MQPIYLDYNATTPIAPSVLEAMQPFLTKYYGNPSSDHSIGRATFHAVDDAREKVAGLLGSTHDEIIFTSGGTESNNLAILGTLRNSSTDVKSHLVISAIEHPAVSAPARFLQQLGFEVTICPSDSNGVVLPRAIQNCLKENTKLVSIMHANNEIGTVQPIREIVKICRSRQILVHTDAAQSVGKIPTNLAELDVDLLSLAGHKIYAPKGIGALYVRRGVDLCPVLFGAGHEFGLRPGTENVPHIIALGAAAELASRGSQETHHRLALLRDKLMNLLRTYFGNELVVHGENANRLPNTLSVSFPKINGQNLLRSIPQIAASVGSACHGGENFGSTTLEAMQVSPAVAQGTIRLSIGWPTSIDEIERAAELLIDGWEKLTS